ncbi:MAG: SLC13 family permease [Candidatus Competibacteraceae bacterium]
MAGDTLAVFGLLLVSIGLFISDRVRPDIVAWFVILALMVGGLLPVNDALVGFSDPIVFLMAGMLVISQGLVQTGIAATVGRWLLRRAGENETRLLVWLMLVVAGLGAFINSTGLTALFIPIVLNISQKTGISPGRLLLPLAMAALISGMMTLIATAPNLVVSAELQAAGLTPFRFFSFTPIGLAVLAVSLGYMVTLGCRLLPVETLNKSSVRPRATLADLGKSYGVSGRGHRLRLRSTSRWVGRSVAELHWRPRYGVTLIGIERRHGAGKLVLPAQADTVLQAGDVLGVIGDDAGIAALATVESLEELPFQERHRYHFRQEIGLAEVMLPPDSELIGQTLQQVDFRARSGLIVLAIKRQQQPLPGNLSQEPLAFGDTLLVAGSWERIARLRTDPRDFLVLNLPQEVDEVAPARRQAPVALVILLVMVGLMGFNVVPNVVAVLGAALAMGLCRCLDSDRVYRAIRWRSLIVIAGLLPLADALQRTGGIELLVKMLVTGLGHLGPHAMLASLFLLTAGLSMVMSNTATTVLIAPVAIATAQQLGVSPYPFAMTVAIAASAAFVTPVASPVNTLVLGPGQYRFIDFVRVGLPLLLLVMGVTIFLIPWLYPW